MKTILPIVALVLVGTVSASSWKTSLSQVSTPALSQLSSAADESESQCLCPPEIEPEQYTVEGFVCETYWFCLALDADVAKATALAAKEVGDTKVAYAQTTTTLNAASTALSDAESDAADANTGYNDAYTAWEEAVVS
jgi:hypothetical protein